MKKITSGSKARQARIARKRRQRVAKAVKSNPTAQPAPKGGWPSLRPKVVQPEAGDVVFEVPRNFSFKEDSQAEATRFIRALRNADSLPSSRVVIDFRRCIYLGAEMMLPLHAEIYRLRAKRGADFIRGWLPHDEKVSAVLRVMQLVPALRGGGRQLPPRPKDGVREEAVVIETGTTLDGSESRRVARAFVRGLNLDDKSYSRVHAALNDALENISEHAYDGAEESEERRWWVCSVGLEHQPDSYLLAYDLGVTIPTTIPQKAVRSGGGYLASILKSLQRASLDGVPQEDLLKAAFDPTVTRRPSGKGGRGLPRMRQLATQYNGVLIVWSGGAMAVCNDKGKLMTARLKEQVPGTFVLWRIKSRPN